MDSITSRDNERVKDVCRLAASPSFRAEVGLVFAEGKRLCFDLATTLRPRTAFFTKQFLKTCPEAETLAPEAVLISDPVADKISETKTPQGLFCLFEMPRATLQDLNIADGILFCEGVQNPANIGAILRSAAAFGMGGVLLVDGCADPFSPKSLRAGMGAVGRLPIVCGVHLDAAIDWLKTSGVTLYATALEGGKPLKDISIQMPFALMVGGEAKGLSEQAISAAQHTVYIPMHHGVESLNAAVAGSVLMYHFKTI